MKIEKWVGLWDGHEFTDAQKREMLGEDFEERNFVIQATCGCLAGFSVCVPRARFNQDRLAVERAVAEEVRAAEAGVLTFTCSRCGAHLEGKCD